LYDSFSSDRIFGCEPNCSEYAKGTWYAEAQGIFHLAATYVAMSSFSFLFNMLVLGDTSLYLLLDVSAQIMLRTNGKANEPPIIVFCVGQS
jgi:hypothetical protein